MDKKTTFGHWRRVAPYTDFKMRKFSRPFSVGGVTTPETLNELTIGQLIDLSGISDFDGMRVDMNYMLCCPSVHAVVQKEELIMGMGGDIRARSEGFPQDKADLLAKWVALHRNEIMENHQRANDGRPMRWIPPLNE